MGLGQTRRVRSIHPHLTALSVLKCLKNKNPFDQNSAHILHIRGLYRNSVSSAKQLKGFGEGFDSEQRDETAVTVPASSWLDLINDKEPELRKDKIKKKIRFFNTCLTKWKQNDRGLLRTGRDERLHLYWESHQVHPWKVNTAAPALAVLHASPTDGTSSWTPSSSLEPCWEKCATQLRALTR